MISKQTDRLVTHQWLTVRTLMVGVRSPLVGFGRAASLFACLLSFAGITRVTLADEERLGPGTELTIYNQNFAVIKERRVLALAKGTSEVKYTGVAATIVPESVQFRALRPVGARVLEQNYEFDLVNAGKLLQKFVDRRISIVGRDGSLTEGKLLSSDDAQVVLGNDQGILLIPRANNIKDIRLSRLPEGLLTRPTLVWNVDADRAGDHLVSVAYCANSINWRVDYRAVCSADEKMMDLSGWVTITNQTGMTFEDARLKLMAGDVNVVRKGAARSDDEQVFAFFFPNRKSRSGRGFEEKSFSEYHLYTLGRRATLANAQTKQIELVAVDRIPVEKRYLYRSGFGTRVGVLFEFKNAKETREGLGIPLPKGTIRAYLQDVDGQAEFIGGDQIDHTPKNEPVKIRTGYTFDLAAERVMTANRQRSGQKWNAQDWRVTFHNHKDQPVTIRVEESLQSNRNWTIRDHNVQYTAKNDRTIEFLLDVPANGRKILTYTVEYARQPNQIFR